MRPRVKALTLLLAFPLLTLLSIPLTAQDSTDTSVADAARRAREQKKSVPKPAPVITNDNIPAAPKPDSSAPAGTPPATSPDAAPQPAPATAATPAPSAPTTDSSAQTGDTAAAASAPGANDAATKPADAKPNPEVVALKQQLADEQKQVDLLLRLYALDQDAYLTNPDHAKDLDGKAKLDAQQEEIHAKVTEVARLKAKLDALAPGESAKVIAPKP
jgi:hypothetical protein